MWVLGRRMRMNCFVSLPSVATLNKSPFSASYSHLTLELLCYEWAACYSPWAQALMLTSSDNTNEPQTHLGRWLRNTFPTREESISICLVEGLGICSLKSSLHSHARAGLRKKSNLSDGERRARLLLRKTLPIGQPRQWHYIPLR